MAEMRYLETFLDDAQDKVRSLRFRNKLAGTLSMLETFPESGRIASERRITSRYGKRARVLVVGSYDLVYTYDEESDIVHLYTLLPQKSVY